MSAKKGTLSEEGLRKLGHIILQARRQKHLSLRGFQALTGTSYNTVRRLELYTEGKCECTPTYQTLENLAPYLGYSAPQLWSIACGRQNLESEQGYSDKLLSDVWTKVCRLSREELIKLQQLIDSKLET